MAGPFIGSEAVQAGVLTKRELTADHVRLFRDVYVARDLDVTAADRAKAGWLWSRRRGVVAGFSASALHGSKWVEPTRPAELIHDNRHRLSGLRVCTNTFEPDEIQTIAVVPVTIPARTALDLACWYPTMVAVLRLVLIRGGLPRPKTQIRVYDERTAEVAYLDMGWEDLKVAAEYDGEHHRSDPRQYRHDTKRHEMLQRLGWIVIRVLAGDREPDIIRRVRAARARRTPLPAPQ